jgi:hypothetical protein
MFFRNACGHAAQTPCGLHELLDPHPNVKPIQDVLGARMQEGWELTDRVTAVGLEGDLLARQNTLGFEYVAQPTLGVSINAAHECEDFGSAFARYALAGNDLKATGPDGRAIASPNVSAVKSHRD